MFVHLSLHEARYGRGGELVASMHRFARAGAGSRGLRQVLTLKDERTGTLVGLAIWESREAWERGVAAMRAAVEDDPFDDWEQHDPDVYTLAEV
jgi:heme-degrading monooxygenase HmoA